MVVSNHTQLLAGYATNNALDTEDEKKKVQFTSLKSKSSGAIYKSLKNVANRNKSSECYNQQSVTTKVFPGTNIKKKSLSSLLTKVHKNTLSQQYDAKGATKYHFESSSELSYSSDSLDDIDFDSDDEEEELDDELLVELERVKQQYSKENAALKADVVSLESRIQELEELVARLVARGNSSNGNGSTNRKKALKVVKDIAKTYINEQCLDIGTKSKINNLIKDKSLDDLRQLVKDEHAKVDQDHRLAKKLMDDRQLYGFVYRLSNKYWEESKRRTAEKLAKKKEILDAILSDLERNAQFLNPNQAAYVIQCIFVSHLLLNFIVCYCVLHVSTLFYIRMLPVYTPIRQKQRARCSPQYSCKSKSLGMLV